MSTRPARKATIGSLKDADTAKVEVTESSDLEHVTIEITGRPGTPDMDLLSAFTTLAESGVLRSKMTVSMAVWSKLLVAGAKIGQP